MTRCFLALGGNVGPVEQSFDRAVEELAARSEVGVVRHSGRHRTSPVGPSRGDDFLNAALEIETTLSPLALLDLLQEIERRLGRLRTAHWGPRTIDLDIIFYGTQVIEHPRLHVPHPACWYRRFVLDPLVEIAGDFVHPEKRLPVQRLRQRLLVRPLPVGVAGGETGFRRNLINRLAARFAEVEFMEWTGASETSMADPALLFWRGVAATADSQQAGGDSSDLPFDALPVVPRIDVSSPGVDVTGFVRDVIASALG